MSNNVTKAVELIYSMDREELNQVAEAINLKRNYLARQATRTIKVGDSVNFKGRKGENITGLVVKVNRKTLQVKTATTLWKVTASLCEKVETA